jgi:ATP-binding cassette subfamily B protein
MLLGAMGVSKRQRALRILAAVSARGADMASLLAVARRVGVEGRGLRLPVDRYEQLPLPCIAHVDGNHFVVLERVRGDVIEVLDPALGRVRATRAELSRRTSGAYLYLEPRSRAEIIAALDAVVPEDARRAEVLWRTFFRPLLLPLRPFAFWLLAGSAALQLVGLVAPLAGQRLVDAATGTNRSMVDQIPFWIGALALAQAAQLGLTALRDGALRRVQRRWGMSAGEHIFSHLVKLPLRVLESYRREDLLVAIETRHAYAQLVGPGFVQSLFDVVQVVLYAGLLVHYTHAAAAGVLTLLLVSAAFLTQRMAALRTARRRQLYAVTNAVRSAGDTLDGIAVVKLAGAERDRTDRWVERMQLSLDASIAVDRQSSALQLEQMAVGFAAQLLVYFIGASLVRDRTLSPGEFVAIITVVTVLVARTQSVVHLWTTVVEVRTVAERLHDMLLHAPEPDAPDPAPDAPAAVGGQLELHDVSYRYDGVAAAALQGVNLRFPARGRVAIVGRNGSGKSTLLKVISGLYRDHGGVMSLAGESAASMPVHEWRRHVGVVPQDAYLFEGSLRDNLSLLRPDASDDELWDAVEQADLAALVRSTTLGLDAPITAGGRNLSGGQRLRVAIGRLFVANPRIVLLDEASSALDPIAERMLLDNVNQRYQDRLIISAAHRLNTVANSDWLVVLEGGSVIAQGTHDTLLRDEPRYVSLVDAFAGRGVTRAADPSHASS